MSRLLRRQKHRIGVPAGKFGTNSLISPPIVASLRLFSRPTCPQSDSETGFLLHRGCEISKTVLITGAARRIGRQIASDMAACGWSVAIHCRESKTEASELAEGIRSRGGRADVFCAELSSVRSIADLVRGASEALGSISALINNASEFHPDTLQTLDEPTWDRHAAINLKAPIFLAQAFEKQLPPGEDGNIINIIDQRVWNLTPDFFSYTISKSGLWTATQTLAQGLAPRIRVNAIAPGPVLQSVHQTEDDFEREKASTLLRRGSSVEEIAAAVRFILASPGLTGQMIALDGGQHLT